jgi:hypothetical protein
LCGHIRVLDAAAIHKEVAFQNRGVLNDWTLISGKRFAADSIALFKTARRAADKKSLANRDEKQKER